jgi:spermidine/putrescine transport system permease protein
MDNRATRLRHSMITAWSLAVIVFVYIPTVCIVLASLTASRYFQFPIAKWGLDWWHKTLNSIEVRQLLSTSLSIALMVTVVAVVLAFFGALAFARYEWKGRSLFQKIILLPIFFPQSVMGLALLLWFNTLGLPLSWKTAVFAHLVWIVPVVTLVMSIQVYSFDPALEEAAYDLGASRWQVLREVTLPVLFPGIFSGALFAFLLSWGNFPLSLFTTGADTTVPEYLYAKMVAGYTPGVPVLGTISTGRRDLPAARRLCPDCRHAPGRRHEYNGESDT